MGSRSQKSTNDETQYWFSEIVANLEVGECPVGVSCDLSMAIEYVNQDNLNELCYNGSEGCKILILEYLSINPSYFLYHVYLYAKLRFAHIKAKESFLFENNCNSSLNDHVFWFAEN